MEERKKVSSYCFPIENPMFSVREEKSGSGVTETVDQRKLKAAREDNEHARSLKNKKTFSFPSAKKCLRKGNERGMSEA